MHYHNAQEVPQVRHTTLWCPWRTCGTCSQLNSKAVSADEDIGSFSRFIPAFDHGAQHGHDGVFRRSMVLVVRFQVFRCLGGSAKRVRTPTNRQDLKCEDQNSREVRSCGKNASDLHFDVSSQIEFMKSAKASGDLSAVLCMTTPRSLTIPPFLSILGCSGPYSM